ncbi:MAG TPA: cation:dicarboxylase symporter family transporter [Candidatus Angelobacter sp.]|nr:cation:dicarboxylase symporter family transporter [Candidatus Angelobacter sp.]
MTSPQSGKNLLIIFLVLSGLAAVLWSVEHYTGMPVPASLLEVIRWAAILALCLYAWKRRSLTAWIVVGMLVGTEIGYDWPNAAKHLEVLSTIFLRLIKTIVAPLIFGTLVVGIAGHSDLKQVGRMGVKAIVYFEIITTFALIIGLAAINLSQAGSGVTPPEHPAATTSAAPSPSASDIILHAFPENIAKSVADAQVLQVVVFSIFFGIALALLSEEKRQPMIRFCESLSEVMFKFTNIVMLFAPVGICGAMAYTIGTMGFGVLLNLAKLLATLYAALFVFLFCVLLPVAVLMRLNVRRFIQAVIEPVSIAFATASSEAALPRAMEAMEAFGVPRQIVAFVMPTGYSFNLDGSTLYLSLAAIFVAQAAGIHMSIGQQVVMMLTLMLTSKGVAGVPRAMLVILSGTVDSFHLPMWPVVILLGVDQLMDMARTATNVLGNCLATAVVARWEGSLGKEAPSPTVLDAVAE